MVASNLDIKNMRDRGLFNDTRSEKLQNKFNTRIVKMESWLLLVNVDTTNSCFVIPLPQIKANHLTYIAA